MTASRLTRGYFVIAFDRTMYSFRRSAATQMSSLSDLPEVIGFFSYSREDDASFKGTLSALRDGIQHELSAQLGRSKTTFRLWQDKEAIAPGRLWESEIKTAVEQAVFFIPIVTPRAVNSNYCHFEFEAFLARERALGRTDLVFPILYIPVPALENEAQWRDHPVLSAIAKRQYVDWQTFRYSDAPTPAMREAIAGFSRKIVDALRQSWLSPEERRQQEEAATQLRVEDEHRRHEAESKRRAEEDAQRKQAEAKAQRVAENRRQSVTPKPPLPVPASAHLTPPNVAPEFLSAKSATNTEQRNDGGRSSTRDLHSTLITALWPENDRNKIIRFTLLLIMVAMILPIFLLLILMTREDQMLLYGIPCAASVYIAAISALGRRLAIWVALISAAGVLAVADLFGGAYVRYILDYGFDRFYVVNMIGFVTALVCQSVVLGNLVERGWRRPYWRLAAAMLLGNLVLSGVGFLSISLNGSGQISDLEDVAEIAGYFLAVSIGVAILSSAVMTLIEHMIPNRVR